MAGTVIIAPGFIMFVGFAVRSDTVQHVFNIVMNEARLKLHCADARGGTNGKHRHLPFNKIFLSDKVLNIRCDIINVVKSFSG